MAAVVRRAKAAAAKHERTARRKELPAAGRAYVTLVAAAAVAAIAALVPHAAWATTNVVTFGILAAGTAVGAFLIVPTEPNHAFNTAIIFVAAAVLLLPPELVALIGVADFVAEVARRLAPWYSQVFNLANYTLNGLAAWATAHGVAALAPGPEKLGTAAGVVAACAVLVITNHLLLAIALRLARARSFAHSGLFSWNSLSTELLLAFAGATLAAVWRANIYLAPLVLAPLVLINRSFSLLELLRRSERRFRAIYESTAMGIRLTDTHGRIVDANKAFARMLGADPEDLLGTTVAERLHPDDVEASTNLFRELLDGRHDCVALEQRYVRTDGTIGWAHVTESLVRNADGDSAFTIGMVHDVTDRKLLEERLNQTQKLEAVGRLAGGVAHDFNNLLTVITAHSGFVLGSLDAGEPIGRDDIDAIAKAAAKASALTTQLLAVGRRQMRQPRVLDLNAIVLDMHTLLARTMGSEVRIGLDLEASLAPVRADAGQIEQVLVNLALNAGDAMPDGGELTIRTATVPAPPSRRPDDPTEHVLLAVSDTGVGMDAETKARMFEPFFTTKPGSGTGLGLASVYGIVAQSGGVVHVDSAPGKGTTISVYLPQAAATGTASNVAAPTPARTSDARPTVLLVDDEDLVRAAARRLLASHGYSVVEAFDGFEAIEIARERPFDVLVTDLVMPKMSGSELAERLLRDHPGVPVIYVSGYSDDAVTSLPTAGEQVRLVQKPFTEETLVAAVRDALGDVPMPGRELGAAARR